MHMNKFSLGALSLEILWTHEHCMVCAHIMPQRFQGKNNIQPNTGRIRICVVLHELFY